MRTSRAYLARIEGTLVSTRKEMAMSEISEQYQRLSDEFANKIAKVPDDKWSAPSPCPDWTARDVVQHVVDTQGMFLGFVGKELGSIPSVDDDPAAAWDAARAKTQRAARRPRRRRNRVRRLLRTLPLRRGGQSFPVLRPGRTRHGTSHARPDSTSGSTPTTWLGCAPRPKRSATRCGVRGAIGPEIEAPAGADEQTQFLAFLGRRA